MLPSLSHMVVNEQICHVESEITQRWAYHLDQAYVITNSVQNDFNYLTVSEKTNTLLLKGHAGTKSVTSDPEFNYKRNYTRSLIWILSPLHSVASFSNHKFNLTSLLRKPCWGNFIYSLDPVQEWKSTFGSKFTGDPFDLCQATDQSERVLIQEAMAPHKII